MSFVDTLIVLGIFGFFALLILSKLRKKNPERYDKTMGWLKSKTNKVPKLPTKLGEKELNIKSEEARIM